MSDLHETGQLITQAVGVLMKRYDIERDRAAALLARVAERSSVPVEALARRVLGTALDPGDPSPLR
jgi:AmiR/NasT family two-component response regulator